MALSRKTKAMIIWRLNPWFLMQITLVLGAFVLVFQVTSLISLMFQHSLPALSYGLIFFPLLGIQFFRWWAIGQGWSLVCVHELTASSLKQQLMGENGGDVPLEVQSALVRKAIRSGWLTWSDVIETARESGLPDAKLHISNFLGGHRSRVARTRDWAKAVDPSAWRGGRIDASMPDVTTTVPRARF